MNEKIEGLSCRLSLFLDFSMPETGSTGSIPRQRQPGGAGDGGDAASSSNLSLWATWCVVSPLTIPILLSMSSQTGRLGIDKHGISVVTVVAVESHLDSTYRRNSTQNHVVVVSRDGCIYPART